MFVFQWLFMTDRFHFSWSSFKVIGEGGIFSTTFVELQNVFGMRMEQCSPKRVQTACKKQHYSIYAGKAIVVPQLRKKKTKKKLHALSVVCLGTPCLQPWVKGWLK